MIEIGPSQEPLPAELLHRNGGFLWWYIDLIDESGSGAVCIWSYGLPFSPGLASQTRDGSAIPPVERPGWNLVIYRDHKPIFYTLQEPSPEACTWDRDGQIWTMGDTTFRRTIKDGRVEVNIDFDCQLTGLPHRLTGNLSLNGPLRIGAHEKEDSPSNPIENLDRNDVTHTWEPISLGAAHAELHVQTGDWEARVAGRAYHDRNAAWEPLHEQDIKQWTWGRFAFDDREVVLYLLESDSPSAIEYGNTESGYWMEVDATGQWIHKHIRSVDYIGPKNSLYGPTWYDTMVITTYDGTTAHVKQAAPIDNGPFYLRHFATAEIGHETANGISELVIPARVDMAIHRPLVKMRIDNDKPSMWLPLFQGPSTGRVSRLFKHWFS